MNTLLRFSADRIGRIFTVFIDKARQAFADFHWNDAVDILLLTALLYLFLHFVVNRKSKTLLVGILLFFFTYGIAYLFEFSGVLMIFSSILSVGVLFLIILFQPELREALEKAGAGALNGILSFSEQRKKKQMYSSAIDNICRAVDDLSKTKTGALIVIVRTTKLDDIEKTGIRINADVSSFLLRNLFFNKAPLHDGAVIVDEGRIAAAGCLLPLTRRSDVDSDLGTRHRAAIGISETSDSITIVVSEETGIISVAYDCTLIRNFTPDSLRTFLMKKVLHTEKQD